MIGGGHRQNGGESNLLRPLFSSRTENLVIAPGSRKMNVWINQPRQTVPVMRSYTPLIKPAE